MVTRTFKTQKVRRTWVGVSTDRREYYVKECCQEWTGAPFTQVIQWYRWEARHNPTLNADLPSPRPVYAGVPTVIPEETVCGLPLAGGLQECFGHTGEWEVDEGTAGGFISAGGRFALNSAEMTYNPKLNRACYPDNSGLNAIGGKLPIVMGMAMFRPRLMDLCPYEQRPDQRVPFYDSYYFPPHRAIPIGIIHDIG